MGAVDDVMPTAYGESFDILSATNEQGQTGTQVFNAIGSAGDNNTFHYSTGDMVDGFTFTASYVPANGTTEVESSTDFAVAYTGFEGLTLGYAAGEVDEVPAANGTEVNGIDESTMFVTYATGPFTVGYQTSEADGPTTTQDDDSTAMSISYAITDDFSVSYGEHELDLGSSTSDQESEGFSASYTMGGTSIKAAFNETTSVAGVNGTDREGYEIALVFAF